MMCIFRHGPCWMVFQPLPSHTTAVLPRAQNKITQSVAIFQSSHSSEQVSHSITLAAFQITLLKNMSEPNSHFHKHANLTLLLSLSKQKAALHLERLTLHVNKAPYRFTWQGVFLQTPLRQHRGHNTAPQLNWSLHQILLFDHSWNKMFEKCTFK